MIIEQIENNFQGDKYEYSPLAGFSIISTGHLVVLKARHHCVPPDLGGLRGRGNVGEFSASSACRMRRYLRNAMAEYSVMVTLTYPARHGFDGTRAKRDLKVMLQRMRRYIGADREYGTFWFFEFQERGSVHFHLFTTHRFPKEWIANSWYEIVGSEDDRHLRAGTRIEKIKSGRKGICAYAAKYAAKQTQKIVPEDFGWTGRFWGAVGRRGDVSAAVLVKPKSLDSLGVVRRINNLQMTLEDAVFKGHARIINKPNTSGMVIYLKEKYLEPIIRMQIILLHNTQSIFCDQKANWCPELEYGYDWSGIDDIT